jgi:hypothetical protein
MDQMTSAGMSGAVAAMPPAPGGDFMALLQELEQAIAADERQGQGGAQQGQLGPQAQRTLSEIALRRNDGQQLALPNPLSNFNDAGQFQSPVQATRPHYDPPQTLGADLVSGARTFAANYADPLGAPSYALGLLAPGARDVWRSVQQGAPEMQTAGSALAPLSMIAKGGRALGSLVRSNPVPAAVTAGGAAALSSDPAEGQIRTGETAGGVAAPPSEAPRPARDKPIADRVIEALGGAASEASAMIKRQLGGGDQFTPVPLEEYRQQNMRPQLTKDQYIAAEVEKVKTDPAYVAAIEKNQYKTAERLKKEAEDRGARAFASIDPNAEQKRVDQRYQEYVVDLKKRETENNDKPFKDRNPSLAAMATFLPAVVGGTAGYRTVSQFNKAGREIAAKLERGGLSHGEEAALRLAMQKMDAKGPNLIPSMLGTAGLSVETRGMMDAYDKFAMPEDSGAYKKVSEKFMPDSLSKLGNLIKEYAINAASGPLSVKAGGTLQKAIGKGGPNVEEVLAPLDDAGMEGARRSIAAYRGSGAPAAPSPPAAPPPLPVHPKHPNRDVHGRFISRN